MQTNRDNSLDAVSAHNHNHGGGPAEILPGTVPYLTSDDQIAAVKGMCAELVSDHPDLVADAWVNDWGRFGNFDIFVIPVNHDRHTTKRLKAVVHKVMPERAHLREYFSPDPIYRSTSSGRRELERYSRKWWSFDIDFMAYDRNNNQFS